MSKKGAKIAGLVERHRGHDLDARYLGYFECFNQGLFYEAHDVLEDLWLTNRRGPDDAFYKGLIQLAGAFVHLQKDRLRPAAALFRLAAGHLRPYPATHHRLEVARVLGLAEAWLRAIEVSEFKVNPLTGSQNPRLELARP